MVSTPKPAQTNRRRPVRNSLNLPNIPNRLPNLTNIQRIVIPLSLGLGVFDRRVLPRLREGAVVPDVSVVGETVADETEFAFFDVCGRGGYDGGEGGVSFGVRLRESTAVEYQGISLSYQGLGAIGNQI